MNFAVIIRSYLLNENLNVQSKMFYNSETFYVHNLLNDVYEKISDYSALTYLRNESPF